MTSSVLLSLKTLKLGISLFPYPIIQGLLRITLGVCCLGWWLILSFNAWPKACNMSIIVVLIYSLRSYKLIFLSPASLLSFFSSVQSSVVTSCNCLQLVTEILLLMLIFQKHVFLQSVASCIVSKWCWYQDWVFQELYDCLHPWHYRLLWSPLLEFGIQYIADCSYA